MENEVGWYLKDYITPNINEPSLRWKWKTLDDCNLLRDDINKLKSILKNKNMKISKGEDKLIWSWEKNGEYNVKEGYNYIYNNGQQSKTSLPIKLCWDSLYLSKSGTFLWEALQNKILTLDWFRKHGSEGPNRCPYVRKMKNHQIFCY